jgi:DNA-binding transcriptional MerR regulator
MMTVHEVSILTGVSIRTLQYYDRIGLLHPAEYTDAGYRLYDDAALETLQQILLFRELEFPLKDIQRIIQNPSFDRQKALDQQITLLELKKEHLDNLIILAREIKATGVKTKMDFSAFDTKKMDEYAEKAKKAWGDTPAYQEYEQKTKGRSKAEIMEVSRQMMDIFAEFGAVRNGDPASPEAQTLVRKLQDFISAHYYTCTNQILSGLGQMYAAGGEMSGNIDSCGGEGTAAFAGRAIEVFCAW